MLKILFFVCNFLLLTSQIDGIRRSLGGESGVESWTGKWFPLNSISLSTTPTTTTTTTTTAVTRTPHRRVHKKVLTTESPAEAIESWTGKWFPHLPRTDSWDGKWFPHAPVTDSWSGKWFPHSPFTGRPSAYADKSERFEKIDFCDDGKHHIDIDFTPKDIRQSYNYLCLDNRNAYLPNMNRNAILTEHMVPPAYVPPVKCLNESIKYDEVLPTFGAFRPIPPKFGTYQYLPPQRWLFSLAEGAIVMLYHPCAFSGQIRALEKTLRGCMYRHIITPSQALSPKRPLALLAWGKALQMSVVDDKLVVDFIRKNALKGIMSQWDHSKDIAYEAGLLSEAHLVTDINDVEICGFKEM